MAKKGTAQTIRLPGLGTARTRIMDGFARGNARSKNVRYGSRTKDMNKEYIDRQAYLDRIANSEPTGNDNDP